MLRVGSGVGSVCVGGGNTRRCCRYIVSTFLRGSPRPAHSPPDPGPFHLCIQSTNPIKDKSLVHPRAPSRTYG